MSERKANAIADTLRTGILGGKYAATMPLPSVRALMMSFGVARATAAAALKILEREKMAQEIFSLKHTGDNFKKIVIDGQISAKYRDDNGICHIGLAEFLLHPSSIETL